MRRRPYNISRLTHYAASGSGSSGGGSSIETTSERTNDNFDGYSTGAGTPAGWTDSGTGSGYTITVQADGGSPGGQSLEIDKTATGLESANLTFDESSGSISALMLYESTANGRPGLEVNWDDATESGYLMQMDTDTNSVAIYRATSGSYTLLDSFSFTLNAGTSYWVRLHYDLAQTRVLGKIWADGSDEPDTWNLDASDATYASGHVGIRLFSSSVVATATYHRVSWGEDGDCGCVMDDADFPLEGVYITESLDETLRMMENDGSNHAVIAIGPYQDNLDGLAVSKATGEIFCVDSAGSNELLKFDRFGTRRTNYGAVANWGGGSILTINEDDNLLYYNVRVASTGQLRSISYTNTDDTLVVGSINWASEVYYNPSDQLIYVSALNQAMSYDTNGILQHTYPVDADQISIVADASDIYTGSFSGGDLTSCPMVDLHILSKILP